jgi:glycosyltransferase involved in cell wall biosynthesis
VNARPVVYLALGRYRYRAARRHTERLTTGGAGVVLVVADRPESADLDGLTGATVHRLAATTPQGLLDAARRLLLGRHGLLRDADRLVVGDLEALPVAYEAAGQRRDLTISFDPSGEAGRRPAPADLAVVTPWYPSPNDELSGVFVRSATEAVAGHVGRISILHTESWSYPIASPVPSGRIGLMAQRLGSRFGNATVTADPLGELTRVVVPILKRGQEYALWANAHIRALRAALPTGRIEAPLIHAHTGMYGGVVASALARPDARIVITEHGGFLPVVFADPRAARLYDQALARAAVVLCVSRYVQELVRARFPHHAHRLRVVGNVVDVDRIQARPEPPRELLRWLYIGRFTEQKGVGLLLDAFARVAATQPGASLTLVGWGVGEPEIRARVGELGLGDRVTLHPPVPHEEVPAIMHRHDLLVHPSPSETFGLTVVEAIATQTPVLVVRSPGPQETMAGLEGVAGVMVEPTEDPGALVDGYRELCDRLPTLDLPRARASVVARFGREAVSAHVLDALRAPAAAAAPPAASARPRAGRVVVVAIGLREARGAKDLTHVALERGFDVDLVTADAAVAGQVGLDPDVRVHAIGAGEERTLLLRAERLVVHRIPAALLAAAGAVARRWHALGPELAVNRVQRLQRRLSGAVHARLFQPAYKIVRPLVLWRVTRRRVLATLEATPIDRVVVNGAVGVTIGARLARRHRNIPVTTSTSMSFTEARPPVGSQRPAPEPVRSP